ncbi:MAG: hypothetical protein V3G42_10400 [Oscillospiraceae bacterium]
MLWNKYIGSSFRGKITARNPEALQESQKGQAYAYKKKDGRIYQCAAACIHKCLQYSKLADKCRRL